MDLFLLGSDTHRHHRQLFSSELKEMNVCCGCFWQDGCCGGDAIELIRDSVGRIMSAAVRSTYWASSDPLPVMSWPLELVRIVSTPSSWPLVRLCCESICSCLQCTDRQSFFLVPFSVLMVSLFTVSHLPLYPLPDKVLGLAAFGGGRSFIGFHLYFFGKGRGFVHIPICNINLSFEPWLDRTLGLGTSAGLCVDGYGVSQAVSENTVKMPLW